MFYNNNNNNNKKCVWKTKSFLEHTNTKSSKKAKVDKSARKIFTKYYLAWAHNIACMCCMYFASSPIWCSTIGINECCCIDVQSCRGYVANSYVTKDKERFQKMWNAHVNASCMRKCLFERAQELLPLLIQDVLFNSRYQKE